LKKLRKNMIMKVQTKKISIVLISICVIAFACYGLLNINPIPAPTQKAVIGTTTTHLQGTFPTVFITGTSAIVWDVHNQQAIYEKRADEVVPLASITKIMTALTALDLIPQQTVVSINSEALLQEGASGLLPNEKWNLKDLIDFSLIESSNDGIAAVASSAGALTEGLPQERGFGKRSFIDLMNERAQEIGLSDMHFLNESGLDIHDETEGGAFGSARDVAKMFSFVLQYKPEILEPTVTKEKIFVSLDGVEHRAENTNTILEYLPNLLGSKTGYTDIAGGNLAVVIDPGINNPFVIVVLGSTFNERFSDVVTLSQATLEYLESIN